MSLRTRPIQRMFSLVIVLLLVVGMLPVQALATETVYEDEIELSGKFNGQFTLDSSDMKLFNLKDVVPGDTWKGKLHVKNTATAKMEFSIISIVSNLEDNTLFDALDLKISLGDEEIYNGSYGATGVPISNFYSIAAGKKITFDLEVSLPKTAGNNVQNTMMDSTWTFEGRYYGSNAGPSKIKYTVHYVDKDGNDLLPVKTEKGYALRKVTETAPVIDGYKVDLKTKSITLYVGKENKIVFVYSPEQTQTDKPSKPTDSPKPVEPGDGTPKPTQPSETNKPTDEPLSSETPDVPGNSSDDEQTNVPGDGTNDEQGPGDGNNGNGSDKSSVKTGFDLTGGNSVVAVWFFMLGLCTVGGFVVYFRIREEKKRIKDSKPNRKEGTTDVEE